MGKNNNFASIYSSSPLCVWGNEDGQQLRDGWGRGRVYTFEAVCVLTRGYYTVFYGILADAAGGVSGASAVAGLQVVVL